MTLLFRLTLCALLGSSLPAGAVDWTAPAEVRDEDTLFVSYRARLDGDQLIVEATPGSGWHTFAMDNQRRAEEKLAGKPSLGMDKPTEISVSGGLAPVGPWRQTPPKDLSKPELRWYAFGFEGPALFATKVRTISGKPGQVNVRGQACSDKACRNVDVTLEVPVTARSPRASAAGPSGLIQVR